VPVAEKGWTVERYLTYSLSEMVEQERRRATVVTYRKIAERFIVPRIGRVGPPRPATSCTTSAGPPVPARCATKATPARVHQVHAGRRHQLRQSRHRGRLLGLAVGDGNRAARERGHACPETDPGLPS